MIAGHRPMYVDTGWHVADVPLRAALEAMFQKYKVDVAIWGHNHSYQRSCSVNNMTCVDEKFKKEKCRVPYNAYFPFASQNPSSSFPQREPWYDYTYGNVHTIVFSTEHDFSKGSSQYEWLETTLKSVDRSVTPWLMIAGHRPMYVDTGWHVADVPLRAALEAMFQKYKVDVAIWGHNHSYQRSCSVNNMTCVDEKFKKEKCRQK